MVWVLPQVQRVEPPLVAGERLALEAGLDYQRQTLLVKCAGLTADQLRQRAVPPSDLCLLGLIRHMARVERLWFQQALDRRDVDALYRSAAFPSGDFDCTDDADAEADFATLVAEIDTAREIAATHSLDDRLEDSFVNPRTGFSAPTDLRWVYIHMIEEYARHNGHADLLRERIDGAVGD